MMQDFLQVWESLSGNFQIALYYPMGQTYRTGVLGSGRMDLMRSKLTRFTVLLCLRQLVFHITTLICSHNAFTNSPHLEALGIPLEL